ncbi:MAG TPA: hypothetical protein VJ750_11585 [Rhizomicrobium sp.]|nr:hypothetical protein [Rhizomicrobium sp.]
MVRFETLWGNMREYLVLLFALPAGLTLSGLTANTYRLFAIAPQTKLGHALHYAVMAFAGPVVLAGNSTKSFRENRCSKTAYAFALALSAYWSFAMGLSVLGIVAVFHYA